MRLFLLERIDGAEVDEAEGFVVSAEKVRNARFLASQQAGDEGAECWFDYSLTSCSCVGMSYLPSLVVLRAFNAG